jgi:hypothetical protein
MANDDAPFSFEYFESLPDGTQEAALTKYLLEKHPIGSDAASAIEEIKGAGAACGNAIKKYNYCIHRIGGYVPYVEWSFGIRVENDKVVSIIAERTVRTILRQK